ncbi:2Fe-2S iron-sulfur cluster-binding protein [Fuerstiella marisgermanici]|uniref:2Fe-2S ferredoxin-5 n=1 Tax=Fuerstiella marisgermanici TaxID=1891926 RepID=A0A1P8WJ90_9PLAN|nr:2Fe-2S iron-sulfur cluster-binding protein [Fuerstiella marisgermanici]APZ94097.1 2Fe-2S ferredoxin-5 [Fuerstiella marisgermanici]
MPKITFVKEKVTVEAQDGEDIRSVARKNGVQLYSGPHKVLNCMGMGACGSCNVSVKSGSDNCTPRTFCERIVAKWLTPLPLFLIKILSNPSKDVRLACQTKVHGDVEVETHPPINWHGEKFWN